MSTWVLPTLAERRAPTSPYKGLAPFEDSDLDEQLFFGREHEREVIVANVIATRLTVLYGPTGVGKSSVLRAGVARDLRALDDEPLVVVVDAWSEAPAATLAAAVAAAVSIEPGSLSDTIEVAAAQHREIYLLLDQLEEYFVYHGGDAALGDALAELVTRPELSVHVLIAIREDALARLDAFKRRLPGLLANRLQLEHLSRDEGRRAIVGPVERFAVLVPEADELTVEPALVDAVLEGVTAGKLIGTQRGRGSRRAARGRARIETPYLQVVMQRIWEVEREQGSTVLRVSTLEQLGGPERIVGEHLERALGALSPEQKAIAAQAFNYLVTPTGTKIAHRPRDLAGWIGIPEAELAVVLGTLARERILRPVHGVGSEPSYEIFHDVLADAVLAWRADFEARAAVTREHEAARRRQRRLLAIVGVSLIALAIMGATTLYALSQRDQAQQNEALAKSASVHAQDEASKAKAAQLTAQQKTLLAEVARKRADKATRREKVALKAAQDSAAKAKQSQTQAEQSQKQATEQAQLATSEQHKAEGATEDALVAEQKAKQQTKLANKEAANAEKARKDEQKATVAYKATAYAYQSQADLASKPNEGLELAAQAAELAPKLPLAEPTLRKALLAARELSVLDLGDGPAQTDSASLQTAAVGGVQAHSAAFSPDGSLVLAAGETGARLFRTGSRKPLWIIASGVAVDGAAFAKDGRTIALAEKGHVELWNAVTRTRLKKLYQQGSVTHAAFSLDGRMILTSGAKRAQEWDVATGRGVSHPLKLPASVTAAAISPDGSRFLLAAGAGTGIYDTASAAPLFPLPEPSIIRSARFSPLGDALATAAEDRTASIWNVQDGTLRCTTQASDGNLTGVSFSHKGASFVTLDAQGDSRVWDAQTCQQQVLLVGHRSQVVAADFSPNDQYLVTAGRDRSARIFSLPDGTQQAALLGHDDALQSVAFSPDGKQVVTSSSDGTARIWDARVDRSAHRIGAQAPGVGSVAISPDGTLLASAGADGVVRLWNLETRQALRPIVVGSELDDVAFSEDGTLIAAAGVDGSTRLWKVKSHTLSAQYTQPGAVHAIALSSDGRWLATAGVDNDARVFRLNGSTTRIDLVHATVVDDVAFSPDADDLATATADGHAQTWRVATWSQAMTFTGHSAAVNSVAFSPDGKQLVTASMDHDARIWSVATGQTLRVLEGHAGSVSGAAFSADGRWVVTAGPRAAGIWAAKGSDLDHDRLFFVADDYQRITAATFGPDKWRLATATQNGSIATYDCALCSGTPDLLRLAKQRLAQLKAK